MRWGIQQRLTLAIVLTALIPLLGALWLVETTVRQTSERFFLPEIGTRLDEALGLYQELARSVKQGMRFEALAMARDPELVTATRRNDKALAEQTLRRLIREHPDLVSLSIEQADGGVWAQANRGSDVNPDTERQLPVSVPLADDAAPALADGQVTAVLVTAGGRFAGLESMSQFVDTYRQIELRRHVDERSYVLVFGVLLGFAILAAIVVGVLVARGVARRVQGLATATRRAGQGDLALRVPDAGSDELSDLARAFNRMLQEISESRSRIEYLQRIGAWQEMARRLAHEIKNPLTPIQLAVQEIHQRYKGDDPAYQKLVDATLEIVEDEVGTLRRLVSEFSDFARLPQANLEPYDLRAFLQEQSGPLARVEALEGAAGSHAEALAVPGVELSFELPPESADIHMDRQMLRRVLINLIRNAVQAIQGAVSDAAGSATGTAASPVLRGKVVVQLKRVDDYWVLDIDDSGPGIPEAERETVFDPYVTSKRDGTGLGLAIVKKVIIEHGATVSVLDSPLGGARVRSRFPAAGTPAAARAMDSSPPSNPSSTQRRRQLGAPRATILEK